MLIKLVEIKQDSDVKKFTNETERNYFLSEIIVNSEHIVCMREDTSLEQQLLETKEMFPPDLDERQSFTRLNLQRGQLGIDIVVVGTLKVVCEKINKIEKRLLTG